MTTGSTGTKRRTLLQRGMALLAGGAAIAGTSRWAGAASPPPSTAPSSTLTLYARRRPAAHQHSADGRLVASGDLLDGPYGQTIGTFHSNCFCLTSPFGVQPSAANLELHVLQLKDGTLFSMGSGLDTSGERLLAIVGGTDRFAGRSGTYVQRSIAVEGRGDVRQLIITFAS